MTDTPASCQSRTFVHILELNHTDVMVINMHLSHLVKEKLKINTQLTNTKYKKLHYF